jgi:hypothetical protein
MGNEHIHKCLFVVDREEFNRFQKGCVEEKTNTLVRRRYPKVPEQQRIGECLTSLDDLIAAKTQKLQASRMA